ncbi:hypothetical protein [Phyllobacterium zundukense]|uniref:hypothetical protein n=1 Tax=Phyllobacterium zundukense TaxID=1867719 RepID=UPI001300066E|nr:hypothetical protein [Phyllobacterium zundukense]
MANTIEIEPSEAITIQREKDSCAVKTVKPENMPKEDQINYDLAPLDGPVIYLTHTVSN